MAKQVQEHIAKRADLQAVWESIAASDLKEMKAEQRKLIYHGVGVAVRTALAMERQCDHVAPITRFDGLLALISSAVGAEQPLDITGAKNLLRERGGQGHALASRLSKRSKARNCAAHSDPGLEEDLLAFLCTTSAEHERIIADRKAAEMKSEHNDKAVNLEQDALTQDQIITDKEAAVMESEQKNNDGNLEHKAKVQTEVEQQMADITMAQVQPEQGVKQDRNYVYLPIVSGSTRLLEEESPGVWRVGNKEYPSVFFRAAKSLDTKIKGKRINSSRTIEGIDEGDGWLKCLAD